jgi:hypothetical protein
MKKFVKVCLVCLFAIMILSCFESKTKQAVLIVEITKISSESYGIEKFKQALNTGGQITISIDEITSEWYNFEKYSITKDGSYIIRGAVINFICQEFGWKYHGSEMSNIVFVKEVK